jgi:uncharacterized membrane protein
MEEDELLRYLTNTAKSIQRSLRFSVSASMIFPVFSVIFYFFGPGYISLTTVLASITSLIVVYCIHYSSHGHIQNWWWLKPGFFVTIPTTSDVDQARKWCKDQSYEFVEVTTGVFKFFKSRDAVHFKLSCF